MSNSQRGWRLCKLECIKLKCKERRRRRERTRIKRKSEGECPDEEERRGFVERR